MSHPLRILGARQVTSIATASHVVFLHNTMTSSAIYDGALALLPEISAHLIDFRAHGERVNECDGYSAESLATDVWNYIQRMGLERVSLVGSSIGATVALILARDHAAHIDKLVLLGCQSNAASLGERFTISVNAALLAQVGAIGLFVSQGLAALFSPHTLRERAPVAAPWRAHLQGLPKRAIATAMRGWAARPNLVGALPAIQHATLFITSEDDASCPPSASREAARLMPRATWVAVKDAGHMVPVEQPERFAELVRQHLLT